MTTNAGAEQLSKRSIGFSSQDNSTDGMEVLRRTFTPEFRNRLDAIVQFKPLNPDVIKHVVDKFLVELQAQLDDKKVVIDVDEDAREWLAKHGYDEKMGARPMSRLIQDKMKRPLAEDILFGALSEKGGRVNVSVEEDDLKLEVEAA